MGRAAVSVGRRTVTMPVWVLPCAYCVREFTAPAPREHCSLLCRHRHRWYGVTPATHRTYAVRRADYDVARRTSTTNPDTEES